VVLADPFADLNDVSEGPTRQLVSRYRWWLVAATVVAVVAVGATMFVRWLYGASAIESGFNTGTLHVTVGQPYYTPPTLFSASDHGTTTVDVRSIEPRVINNSANASIKVLTCKRNGTIAEMGGPDLNAYAWCHPFTPGKMTIGQGNAGQMTVVLAVTAHRLGSLEITGTHVSYRQGIRHGSVNAGPDTQMWAGTTNPFPDN
jgi:hypothetical protein